MRRKKNAKMHDVVVDAAPVLTGIEDMIINLNSRLDKVRSGNYSMIIKKISDARRVNINSEYYVDVTIHMVDLTNVCRSEGLVVPGMGPKPIDLNKNIKLHTNVFFDWEDFEDSLFEKAARWQKSINEDGYYPKKRNNDTGREEYV